MTLRPKHSSTLQPKNTRTKATGIRKSYFRVRHLYKEVPMFSNTSGFAVIDFETTGVNPERNDRAIEIGLVLTDPTGEIIEEHETLAPITDARPWFRAIMGRTKNW
ncbi:hypothetical protein I6E29_08655 [Arcanobacterium haemolyticum]|nr:hypothetical protein [Arcanobacterium haemolyticum]